MIFNDKCIPISLVRIVPIYSGKNKDGLDKSYGWLVQVDFAGIGVPKMYVRGGSAYEYNVEASPEIYSGQYPFVTRVEYHFKESLFKNTYRNVCRFQNNISKRIRKNTPECLAQTDKIDVLWRAFSGHCAQIDAPRQNENTK